MRDRAPGAFSIALIASVVLASAVFALLPHPVAGRTASVPARAPAALPRVVPSVEGTSAAEAERQERIQQLAFTRAGRSLSSTRASDPMPPEHLLAQGITRVSGAGRRVALTFDDGPSANTSAVLDILTRYRSHATFFMVGRRVEAAPQLARAVVSQGSEIGNHTLTHTELWHASVARDESQITEAEAIIYDATGTRPRYVRPKGGVVDDNGIRAIEGLHKRYVYWDVAGFDTVPTFTAKRIGDEVLRQVRPGSVVVLHETNPRTVAALPEILARLHDRGYRVVDLTRLLHH